MSNLLPFPHNETRTCNACEAEFTTASDEPGFYCPAHIEYVRCEACGEDIHQAFAQPVLDVEGWLIFCRPCAVTN